MSMQFPTNWTRSTSALMSVSESKADTSKPEQTKARFDGGAMRTGSLCLVRKGLLSGPVSAGF